MRTTSILGGASALLSFAITIEAHKGSHEALEALHKRHKENRVKRINESGEAAVEQAVEKRGGQCAFPYGAGLVPVAPGGMNAGWAMSPDEPCIPGKYCPYACPPGQVSMQWDPSATSYTYPASMNGGLFCDNNGNIQKPFPDKPYCQSTATNIGVVNNAGGVVSFCQTVLPGNEAMLIPTAVYDYATLAVPDTSYWAGTAAHYYINGPGIDTNTACVWGTSANAWGNWSPYVAGTNVDNNGNTFIKLGWNPIYLEPTTPFRTQMPDWGVEIQCPNGGCNGLPCAIDPAKNRVNQMLGSASDGAGGGAFCVVTVAKGSTANFVVRGSGGGNGPGKGGQFYSASSSSTTTTTTTASITTTTSATATTTTTVATWSSWNTNNSTSYTASWSASNTTSTTKAGPTGPPSYNLFNDTTQASDAAPSASTPAATPGPTIATHTGSSSQIKTSAMMLLAALALAFV